MSEVARLLAVLPQSWIEVIEDQDQITEIVLDMDRPLEVRYGKRKVFIEDLVLSESDVQRVIDAVGTFGPDNRAGMDKTLHRISRLMDRNNQPVGLTCRVGKAFTGCVGVIEDLVREGESILLLGAPGTGKTTKLRDICRVASTDLDKAVVIVDTSNEIAGDGRVVHPAVGRSRRLQVPNHRSQCEVMQEAVENHTPEVLIVDEIGNREEAEACRTFAQRGVQLIATAHGRVLQDLISNPVLSSLIGGIEKVTLSDAESTRRGTQKAILERAEAPTFSVVVEILGYDRVAVHRNVGEAVDAILSQGLALPEIRQATDDSYRVTQEARIVKPRYSAPVEDKQRNFRMAPAKRSPNFEDIEERRQNHKGRGRNQKFERNKKSKRR